MDDDDDNNNVNKYKITGGKNNGFNNEAFTHKRMYKAKWKGCITSRMGKKIRHLGNVSFLLLRDRTGVIQCVLENELAGYKVDVESVVHVIGEIVETSKTELGVEVLAHEVKVINGAEPLPFEINKRSYKLA